MCQKVRLSDKEFACQSREVIIGLLVLEYGDRKKNLPEYTGSWQFFRSFLNSDLGKAWIEFSFLTSETAAAVNNSAAYAAGCS